MATIGFQLAYGNPHIIHLPEHTTHSSFVPGDLVSIVAGCIQLAAQTQKVFGVVQAAYNGTDFTSTPVHVISAEDIFIVESEATSTTANVGIDYSVNIGTPGSMSVDTNGTGVVTVIDFHEPVGTATGKVLVKFVPSVLQGNTGVTAT